MNVLVVEDSSMMAMLVVDMLEKLDHQATRAGDGQQAVDELAKGDFDVILLDWNMPVMNGLEFLQYNQKNSITNARIIMMTTEDSPEKIEQAMANGASEYIMKPFTSEILESKLSQSDSFL